MKVIIEARLPDPAGSGGVSQAIISLARALSSLKDCRPDESFIFVTLASAGGWLDEHVSGPCRLHKVPLTWKNRLARTQLGPALRVMLAAARGLRPQVPLGISRSDGMAERLGGDLVHFPSQDGYLTALPNIYQPHDLQHLHLPQFFAPYDLEWRTLAYPVYCDNADVVLVESSWTKHDVAHQFAITQDKIAVCPFPPATASYRELSPEALATLQNKLRHPQFIFYPAHTWPHKNHLRLIEALAILKQNGVVVPLVCTGRATPFMPQIEASIAAQDLSDQVQFMGYLSEAEIKTLYRMCTAVVVPTKFESVSFPIWEAFEAGRSVACSTVTSLPTQVGDAGLLFDPEAPAAMAAAIRTLWEDPHLREKLGRLGTIRLQQFSLDRMALHVRALYRRLGGTLTQQDREILAAAPLI